MQIYIVKNYLSGLLKKKNADWCNSNIAGSCPVNKGANPLSVHTLLIKAIA